MVVQSVVYFTFINILKQICTYEYRHVYLHGISTCNPNFSTGAMKTRFSGKKEKKIISTNNVCSFHIILKLAELLSGFSTSAHRGQIPFCRGFPSENRFKRTFTY